MVDEEYKKKVQQFKELLKTKNLVDEENISLQKFKAKNLEGAEAEKFEDLISYLIEKNSFKNPLDRMTAEMIIENQQRVSLDIYGGYPLWREVSFEVSGEKYTIIAYGASDENEGEDALFGMIFVREEE